MYTNQSQIQKENKMLLIIIIICGILFLISGVALLKYYLDYRTQERISQTLEGMRTEDQTKIDSKGVKSFDAEIDNESEKINQSKLLAVNSDYLMWLSVPDTKIDYPVVQRDNDYYLTHNFMGEKSSHGTIFLDEECKDSDSVLLLHGHHMKDGTMFGGLKAYKKVDYVKEHAVLYLDFGTGDTKYCFFAAALIDLDSDLHFRYYEMPKDETERKEYLRKLKDSSLWYLGGSESNVDEVGQIVILSTCEYGAANQRLIVAAVKTEE